MLVHSFFELDILLNTSIRKEIGVGSDFDDVIFPYYVTIKKLAQEIVHRLLHSVCAGGRLANQLRVPSRRY